MPFVCGIDIGGTFTDCVVVDSDGNLTLGKASTTPNDRSQGFMNSLTSAARRLNIEVEDLLKETQRLLHGTTVATNAMVERKGAKVGLITTKGHGDAILMMRGGGRTAGMPVDRVLDLPASYKPEPLVPRTMIREVTERVDFAGEVVVSLDEDEAREAVRSLLEAGAEAICVSFLWSFQNPDHEDRVAAMVRELAPEVFVTASHRLIAKWGEYERTAGAVINSFVGPATESYLTRTASRFESKGYSNPFLIMQSTGGLAPVEECAQAPLLTLGSGPVGGLEGVRFLAETLGLDNVIAGDMGGTSFDIGLVVDGYPVKSSTTIVGQYQYTLPVVDVQSIGSGGGSIAWIDEMSGALRVGPHSAGADPGPVCYARGGAEPTVTDADVVLGYLNPEYFLEGALPLDRKRAEDAIASLGERIGMSPTEAAAGIATIVEFQMADLIRRVTVQKGYDPRDFALFAYGGAGPVHAPVIARELGISKVIVPLGEVAGAWSAMGVAVSNVVRVFEQTQIMYEPFDHEAVTEAYRALEEQALNDLTEQGFGPEDTEFRRFVSMQYGYQVHQVEVPVGNGDLTAEDMERLVADFETLYERLYGRGAGFREAGVQVINFRVEGIGRTSKPRLKSARDSGDGRATPSVQEQRTVYWPERKEFVPTDVYRGEDLAAGHVVRGPAVIEEAFTTVVVHPGQTARVDEYGNIIVEVL
ncbi:MAG: hydantoinase/oxoprolinase family protein [Actinomycetota bacterium]|nr:hydantoinase/oxoprolinase family protein [Actinomycetota bacterium]